MSTSNEPVRTPSGTPQLARSLGLYHATMLVIGGIVGAGIFRNPHVVAKEIHSPVLILGAWILGGMLALVGAWVYAELTSVRPAVGGQYAFFKEAYHPSLAFVYGWALLLVSQTGGMAAVSITFADYTLRLLRYLGAAGVADSLEAAGAVFGPGGGGKLVAVLALALLTVINCLGVRAGATVQSTLTVLKMLAIVGLVYCGFRITPGAAVPAVASPVVPDSVTGFGAAMVPVLFAYGGWQTACFIAGEVKNPRRNLPLGLVLGIVGVIVLYLSVNWICLRTFGPAGLAETTTPAADIAERGLGPRGSIFISAGIVISTLGFLSQGMLTAPRVYYAMADDGLFFSRLARVHPVTAVPVSAIALQGVTAIVIALTGQYDAILNYVVSVDFIFYGLTATCVFIFRARDLRTPGVVDRSAMFSVPGHPWTTLFFIAGCWLVVVNSIYSKPKESLIGIAVLAAGVPAYRIWRRGPVRSSGGAVSGMGRS